MIRKLTLITIALAILASMAVFSGCSNDAVTTESDTGTSSINEEKTKRYDWEVFGVTYARDPVYRGVAAYVELWYCGDFSEDKKYFIGDDTTTSWEHGYAIHGNPWAQAGWYYIKATSTEEDFDNSPIEYFWYWPYNGDHGINFKFE